MCRAQLVTPPQHQPIEASEPGSRLKAYIAEMRQSLSRSHRRNRSVERGIEQHLPATITEGEINYRTDRTRPRTQTVHSDPLPSGE